MTISLLCLISTDIHELINFATFVETMFIAFSVAGLLYMRKKYPDLVRPIKVRLYNISPGAILVRGNPRLPLRGLYCPLPGVGPIIASND